ncbi:MAG TPA: phage portal protein [Paracoccus sp. (in: a-proteobacteria)]|uniref:phage portal protein n=1 Tax=Paracoccus sp. TaxID=267 RepID=UPI002B813291|nr:phage portal protein [Paracoccus sp. (in: a-proteobacteria)]HWL58693.1 phage portal protein [Paracoccus sp. (in: a-proteobacteria)]
MKITALAPVVNRVVTALGIGKGMTSTGYQLPITGGIIPAAWPWNFWQQGRDPIDGGPNAIVHACVDAYAQTIAALPARHVSEYEGEGVQRITTSALSRVLRRPNSYSTKTDFMMNMVKTLLLFGNSYALAYRNDRQEIAELHLLHPRTTTPMVDRESGEIFYAVGENEMLPVETAQMVVPARDMFHLRLYTPRHPLIGISPITHLAASIASTNAINAHQAAFFNNMARPSGVISTDERLTKDQMTQLREAWASNATLLNSGGVPILSAGLKWQAMSITSQDAQLVEAFRMGVEDIARAFRVPLPLVGDTRNANYNNVEILVATWLAQGLGFMIEHIEHGFSAFFALPLDTHCQIDVDALMRTDFAGRVDALTKGITGGLYSPNEARRKEGLADADFGDEPRLQAQVVPLSRVDAEPAESAPAAPVPVAEESRELSVAEVVAKIREAAA